ncbi:leucyl aminopeptidase [Edaphobacillus lindanitolerans]|uniref:Probable cytosol aminopeptidase n=1 Tax=Edaphobacillus lindanitolerans TaxID=550447 RepID=A0A1U7PT01_9BACI|nr:leucyl aminopeptidase [Edaphobacillus lindanitolerans]SIT92003.1 leucyl aminopeptidase [Edaphobacillus lindanitolerans]
MEVKVMENKFSGFEADVLIVGVPKHSDHVPGWEKIDGLFGGRLGEWMRNGDIPNKPKEFAKIPADPGQSFKRVLFTGLGDDKKLDADGLRKVFSAAGKKLREMKAESAAVWADSFALGEMEHLDVAWAAGEGISLGSYRFEDYKTGSNERRAEIREVVLLSEEDGESVMTAFNTGRIYADAVNEARDLVNTPGNMLTASAMAEYAAELAEQYGFEIEVLGKPEMEELGMGALLAVNQGSVEEPRLIVMKYQGTDKWEDVVGLVGKGITFDTGGYSLKTKTGIVGMKGDMGGAAAVLGAMRIIGNVKPKKNVVAVIASTDNMISGNAFKPDDVITSLSGKTIEILNTDAEGRLVLADAVTYAKQAGADYLVDVATLTGGVITALGYDKTGALTNSEPFFETFLEAAAETGEFVWRLPLTESDRKRIRKSEVADLNNSPGSDGHMIFGGGFVGEFVEDTPWIHLDIAGTSDSSAAHDLGPKGGTGVMVRTLATLVEFMAEEQQED